MHVGRCVSEPCVSRATLRFIACRYCISPPCVVSHGFDAQALTSVRTSDVASVKRPEQPGLRVTVLTCLPTASPCASQPGILTALMHLTASLHRSTLRRLVGHASRASEQSADTVLSLRMITCQGQHTVSTRRAVWWQAALIHALATIHVSPKPRARKCDERVARARLSSS